MDGNSGRQRVNPRLRPIAKAFVSISPIPITFDSIPQHFTRLQTARARKVCYWMVQCQATWLYLEPIFSSEDIMAQMPEESRKFSIVDSYWRAIMMESIKDTNCLVVTDQPNMLQRLVEANNLLEDIQRGLNAYLEMKRLFFPRSVITETCQTCHALDKYV